MSALFLSPASLTPIHVYVLIIFGFAALIAFRYRAKEHSVRHTSVIENRKTLRTVSRCIVMLHIPILRIDKYPKYSLRWDHL